MQGSLLKSQLLFYTRLVLEGAEAERAGDTPRRCLGGGAGGGVPLEDVSQSEERRADHLLLRGGLGHLDEGAEEAGGDGLRSGGGVESEQPARKCAADARRARSAMMRERGGGFCEEGRAAAGWGGVPGAEAGFVEGLEAAGALADDGGEEAWGAQARAGARGGG